MAARQHYITCFAPPLLAQKEKCIVTFQKLWITTRTATPIARALKYIPICVTNDSQPLPRNIPSNPSRFDKEIFKAWQEQKKIGWRQLFQGRISANWAKS